MKNLDLRKIETNSKGITLVALVISIIVLLILATVTIQTLTGNNGLLIKAETAVQSNKDSQELEKIQLAVLSAQMKNKNLSEEILNTELQETFNNDKTVIESPSYYIYKTDKSYRIYKDGKVEEGNLLPDEFKQVEYIASTGKQYINTGLLAKDHINIYLEILGNFSSPAKSQYIFGCSDGTSNSSTYHLLGTAYSSSQFIAQHGIGESETIIKSADTHEHTFCLDLLNNTCSLDSEIVNLEYNGTKYINQNYFLFSLNKGGTSQNPASFKMNSCKILENNQLIRYYIPCYSVTNVINVEFQTMRKFTSSIVFQNPYDSQGWLGYKNRLDDIIDHYPMICDYLTKNVVRLVTTSGDKNKSRREDNSFWQYLRQTKSLDGSKCIADSKLIRNYDHEKNVDIVKKRALSSIAGVNLHYKGNDTTCSSEKDLIDFISTLNDNDFADYLRFRNKRLKREDYGDGLGLEVTDKFGFVNKDTGETFNI